MLLFKRDKVRFIDQRSIMLEGEDEVGRFYIYADKNTYNQAILLYTKYQGDFISLLKKLQCPDSIFESANFFNGVMPHPICILGAFLCLADSVELKPDLEFLCGILNQMSMCLAFYEYEKLVGNLFQPVSFDKLFLLSYQDVWDTLQNYYCESLSVEDALVNKILQAVGGTTKYIQENETGISHIQLEQENNEEAEEQEFFDPFAGLAEELAQAWGEIDRQAEEEKQSNDTKSSEEVVIQESEKSEEIQPEKDTYEYLILKMGGSV